MLILCQIDWQPKTAPAIPTGAVLPVIRECEKGRSVRRSLCSLSGNYTSGTVLSRSELLHLLDVE